MREYAPTPVLCIDVATARENIARLSRYAAANNLRLRPHTKTHKTLLFGRMQMEHGAAGLTVAKVGEADVMRQVCDDLLIAYPVVDPHRAQRVAELAGELTVRVAVDSSVAVESLAAAARRRGTKIGILVDLDVGFHRTGVQTADATLELARQIAGESNLRLDGLFCFPGHVWIETSMQAEPMRNMGVMLREAIDLWQRDGLSAAIVSGGSSPTAYQSHLAGVFTEIRPGTYIFNDVDMVRGGYCSYEQCAARVMCTIISNAVPGKVVIDAGSKVFSSDRTPDGKPGHGYVVEYPQATIVRLSEEHGEIDISRCPKPPRIGERVQVIPNHICPCVNLQDQMLLRMENGELELIPIDARGKVV